MNTFGILRRRLAEIAELRAKLDAEEQELLNAERVLSRYTAPPPQETRSRSGPTQVELITDILRRVPDPWLPSTAELHRLIEQTHGVSIKKSSFQPLLSELKQHGKILRDGPKIALAERVQKAPPKVEVP